MSILPILLADSAILSDSFNRVDSATTLGNAETGQIWTPSPGSTWGVITNQAYCVNDGSGSNCAANAGVADFKLSCKLIGSFFTNRSSPQVVFRYLDTNNFLCVVSAGSGASLDVIKNDATVISTLTSTPLTWVDGQVYNLVIRCIGNQITVFLDGVQKISYTLAGGDTKYAAYTKVGMRLTKSGTPTILARWDDLIVESV